MFGIAVVIIAVAACAAVVLMGTEPLPDESREDW